MECQKNHHYHVQIHWIGNLGQGTRSYRSYGRGHEITSGHKPTIVGSSDPAFRGDGNCYNPEELLVASISSCHMLWYLHLCAEAEIVVTAYEDEASGTMAEMENGAGHFTEVKLQPKVTLQAGSDETLAIALHQRAHELCFIANSVNFPIHCEPRMCEPRLG